VVLSGGLGLGVNDVIVDVCHWHGDYVHLVVEYLELENGIPTEYGGYLYMPVLVLRLCFGT
jgi:cytochrome b